eukprot:TRINITY_DN19662_c0_g1_i1.p1 TRINITY_DN19662_c0_g1~~TRINITY_DN19662_c0_g1_i1.p1  ORF type:complete len:343 (+),score=107.59 TRINITY_DN19662_c0_g1_i1:138-1166(+)
MCIRDRISGQLGGEECARARARLDGEEPNLEEVALYSKWKVRYCLEHDRRKKVERELAGLSLRVRGQTEERWERAREGCVTADLGPVSELSAIGVTGTDRFGLPVIVVAAALIANNRRAEQELGIDLVMQYVALHFESLLESSPGVHVCLVLTKVGEAEPAIDLDKVAEGWGLFPERYREGVGRVFVLHAGLWFKMVAKRSLPAELSDRMTFCSTSAELYNELGSKTIILPEYVFDHPGEAAPGRKLFQRSCGHHWQLSLEQMASKAKRTLLRRDQECLKFLVAEKARLLEQEQWADVALIVDETEAIRDEIRRLEAEISHAVVADHDELEQPQDDITAATD